MNGRHPELVANLKAAPPWEKRCRVSMLTPRAAQSSRHLYPQGWKQRRAYTKAIRRDSPIRDRKTSPGRSDSCAGEITAASSTFPYIPFSSFSRGGPKQNVIARTLSQILAPDNNSRRIG